MRLSPRVITSNSNQCRTWQCLDGDTAGTFRGDAKFDATRELQPNGKPQQHIPRTNLLWAKTPISDPLQSSPVHFHRRCRHFQTCDELTIETAAGLGLVLSIFKERRGKILIPNPSQAILSSMPYIIVLLTLASSK